MIKYQKNIKYSKGDEDYFNLALKDDNTYVYSTINQVYQFTDNNNDYEDERNKTVTITDYSIKKDEDIKENKNNDKEEKRVKKKKRRHTINVNENKEKKEKEKDVIVKDNGKVVVKTSGAKNLKELLG